MDSLRLALSALFAFLLTALPGPAAAEPRIALIVGNGAYTAVTPLDNPVNDARLLAKATEDAGFAVTLLTDADQAALNQAIAKFGRDLRAEGPEATGLFYYAGHGVQSFGTNYLLPTDAALTDAADLGLVGVSADTVLRQMASARNQTNIVILDACRNNPFVQIPDMDDNGLAEMKAPTGTFLAYSTAPGAVALDGLDGNSPYTGALAEAISQKGLPIEQLFKQVRVKVLDLTLGRQTPWDTSSLTSEFVFQPEDVLSAEDVAAQQLWTSVQATNDPVQIMLFLRAYPESRFAEEARLALATAMNSVLVPPSGAPVAVLPLEGTPTDVTRPVEAPAAGAATDEATLTAPEPAAPVAKSDRDGEPEPDPREIALIETARKSRLAADYEAYLADFPTGIYSELARFELTILAAASATPPASAAPAVAPAGVETNLASEPETLTFTTPLTTGDEGVVGLSIEALVKGTPLFPPIEGLPDAAWKGQTCTACHSWTKEALCDQGKTYLAESGERAISKPHPYGSPFKRAMRVWAKGGCK